MCAFTLLVCAFTLVVCANSKKIDIPARFPQFEVFLPRRGRGGYANIPEDIRTETLSPPHDTSADTMLQKRFPTQSKYTHAHMDVHTWTCTHGQMQTWARDAMVTQRELSAMRGIHLTRLVGKMRYFQTVFGSGVEEFVRGRDGNWCCRGGSSYSRGGLR